MPYRDELETLRFRQVSLEHEVADVRELLDAMSPASTLRRARRRVAFAVLVTGAIAGAFWFGRRTSAPPAAIASAPIVPAAAEPASEPSAAWRTATTPTFADVALTVGDRTYHFAKGCRGATRQPDLAASLTMRKPNRPEQLNVTGCDGSYASFHVWLDHPASPGPATATLFDLALPGASMQEVQQGARFQITNVTEDRVAGTFEVDVRPREDAPPVRAHGVFDVPRLPDETTPGP